MSRRGYSDQLSASVPEAVECIVRGPLGAASSTRQIGPFRYIGPSSFTNPGAGPVVIQ